ADRRHEHGGLRRGRLEAARPRALAAGDRAGRGAGGTRRRGREHGRVGARGRGAHPRAGRRGRGRARDRPPRARPAPGFARGGVHAPDAGRARVRRRRQPVVSAVSLPVSEFRGRVTQWHVIVSEWTKLKSVRSTRWSLLIATVLTIGFPIL